MQLDTSYKQIMAISLPIMLASAVQNIIALSDSVFLSHLSKDDFGTIGFVGVFYLVVAAIGFGFSKGGQIMIARRIGEGNGDQVGRTFYAMVYFEFALAIVMFLFMKFGCQYFFLLFVDDGGVVYTKSLEYLSYRSYGVFFSYLGVAIVALYTGTAKTWFIVVDTLILALVNIVLNYVLIFGYYGFPEMGIAGAGLASTIAEVIAFIIFIIYIFNDRDSGKYDLFKLPKIDFELIKQQWKIASPIVAQAVVGLGSWFVFFGIIENLGEDELAITNLVRMVYLVLSIPCWGFSSGVNTMVSNFIGADRRDLVLPIINKTAKICLLITLVITLPVALFPEPILYPLFGASTMTTVAEGIAGVSDLSLIQQAQPIFYVLIGILFIFSIGGVYFNGLAGTGATLYGLKIQIFCAIFYLGYIYSIVEFTTGGLEWAWAGEIWYWVLMLGFIVWYMRTDKWHTLKV